LLDDHPEWAVVIAYRGEAVGPRRTLLADAESGAEPSAMKRSPENYDVAKALSEALDPVIDVCLQIGITSPELESLLRAAFVQRAFVRLPRHATTGRGPSDTRVSLATGVHRAEVSRIRAAGGTTSARQRMQTKERLYSKSARVLNGWTSDRKFTSSAGLPIDLPMERSKQHRSFEELVEKYAPGNFPGTVLKELQRRGNVDVLEGDIIRYRSSTTRPRGATESNVAHAAKRVRRLGDTLFRSLLDPEHVHLDVETKPINLTTQQLALLLPEIERSANLYLAGIERQFRARGATGVNDHPKRVGVNMFSWQED